MMLKSFVFLCIFIPLLNATPLKPGSKNHKALLWDHFQVKRTIPDCDSSYVENSGCSSWASLCQDSSYQAFMNENCKDTCGICKAAPPPYSTPENVAFDVSECLAANNLYRPRHGVPDLQWDASLASESADWALYLAKIHNPGDKLKHSDTNGQYGENLFASWTTAIGTVGTCKQAVEKWYSEIKNYDFNKPGPTSGTGHFTQVVWKSTTKIGVGIAAANKIYKGKTWTFTFVVARYTPAGNMETTAAYAENVLPPSK